MSNIHGILRILSLTTFVFTGSAWAQTYKPDFSCNNIPPKNGVAVMLCQNSDAAKHELEFDQAYYALRQTVGQSNWKTLKQEAILDQNAMNQQCGLPIPGDDDQAIPQNGPSCYISGIDKITAKYRSRLTGSALDEASRPIDQHIALQQKLIDLGFLPDGSIADGIYGETTRTAIQTWQRVMHRPMDDAFISNADALILSGQSSQQAITPPTKNPNQAPNISANPDIDQINTSLPESRTDLTTSNSYLKKWGISAYLLTGRNGCKVDLSIDQPTFANNIGDMVKNQIFSARVSDNMGNVAPHLLISIFIQEMSPIFITTLFQNREDINICHFVWKYVNPDPYGNDQVLTAVSFYFSRTTFNKINWSRFDSRNLQQVADIYQADPIFIQKVNAESLVATFDMRQDH